ncbi:rhomboid family intramembrane serine protease [Haloferula sp.]|uniref:rhomboid family intramembrane serine protease n=1 Tax=Haloferula sp. TaxID=2497595 RepID=UPI00329F2E74
MPEGIIEEVDELAVVGQWQSLDEAYEHALVVLAMNLDCFVREIDGFFALEVDSGNEGVIRDELDEYAVEQQQWRERAELPVGAVGMELAMLWVLLLVGIFLCQIKDPAVTERFSNSSIGLFVEGEWWRPFTALFLHADFHHLAGNVLIGGVFCVMVAQSFGQWRGWLLILASGVMGNTITAGVHYPEAFRSIGASTATFGALGLLVGMGVVLAWHSRSYRKLKPIVVPVAVGLVLLGWFGAGGVDTDVLGHLFGWLSGAVLGLVAAWRMKVV